MEKRLSFDTVAELYDRVRPGYPAAMYSDIVEACGLSAGSRILEIGCGTGQATIEFAKLGCAVTAVEIGKNLARIASEKLKAFPNVSIVACAFEGWEHTGDRFDMVVSATAFHWLPPDLAYEKCTNLLGDGGYLALFANNHVRRVEGFFARSQSVYDAHRPPSDAPTLSQEDQREREKAVPQRGRDRSFRSIFSKRYPWTARYTADEYVELLMNLFRSHHDSRPLPHAAPGGTSQLDCERVRRGD